VIVRDATVAPGAEPVYYSATVNMAGARTAVRWLFVLVVAALLVMYALIALSLEVFVLPRNVWRPIRAMLEADDAVREGRREGQVIPATLIPGDELGQIMRSRNSTVSALREQERRLAEALIDLERVASDLQRKNHLLETAKRNLADADRLATLGVMSAGLAHEINTPLAVVKGLAEKLAGAPAQGLAEGEAQLLLRVTARLERLSESLLDFARARPARTDAVDLRAIVDEAWTLVRLDREARGIALHNELSGCTSAHGDPDRLLQVLVNLLRNAVDALRATKSGAPIHQPAIRTTCATVERDGARWLSLRVADNGPGLPAELLGRLFEPFASTRLDDKGTGLGLAVSQGIVQEHGGLLTARNRPAAEGGGAEFEVLLPLRAQG
jgi:two-component system NtrC family sensor kinase